MHTALRAGALLIIAGVVASAVLIFATDPAEAPQKLNGENKGMGFALTSSAFASGEAIPSRFTCDGENVNPPLAIQDVPEGAKSFALIMDDPDVPKQLRPDGVFDHWVLFNIPADTTALAEGETPGVAGANGRGESKYTGPCPPTEYEPTEHRYFFRLYALDSELALPEGATKQEVLDAIGEHLIGMAVLMGTYDRAK